MRRDRDDEPLRGPSAVVLTIVLFAVVLFMLLDRGCVR